MVIMVFLLTPGTDYHWYNIDVCRDIITHREIINRGHEFRNVSIKTRDVRRRVVHIREIVTDSLYLGKYKSTCRFLNDQGR